MSPFDPFAFPPSRRLTISILKELQVLDTMQQQIVVALDLPALTLHT